MAYAPRLRWKFIRCVLFDFDFTIVDSSLGAIECTTHALRALGLCVPEPARIRATIGMSLHRAFYELTNRDCTAMADDFFRIFIEHAEEIMADLTWVYPTTRPTALALKHRGILLGIVSNKYRCGIEPVLNRYSLQNFFEVVVGGEDVCEPKPSPEGLFKAAKQLGVSVKDSIYIGDSLIDAETARRASMQFAAVLTGTTSRADFEAFGTFAIFDDLQNLIVSIDELS